MVNNNRDPQLSIKTLLWMQTDISRMLDLYFGGLKVQNTSQGYTVVIILRIEFNG